MTGFTMRRPGLRAVPEHGVALCPACRHYLPRRVGEVEVTCSSCYVLWRVE